MSKERARQTSAYLTVDSCNVAWQPQLGEMLLCLKKVQRAMIAEETCRIYNNKFLVIFSLLEACNL